ncbi:MAG: C39 family peptidase [Elusimicrobiota bacterium]
MFKIIILILTLFNITNYVYCAPDIKWIKSFGGYGSDTCLWSYPASLKKIGDNIYIYGCNLMKFDKEGNKLWSADYGFGDYHWEKGEFAIDNSGNVYVGVNVYDSSKNINIPYLMKYGANGSLLGKIKFDINDYESYMEGVTYLGESIYVLINKGAYVGKEIEIKKLDLNLNENKRAVEVFTSDFVGQCDIGSDKEGRVYISGSISGRDIFVYSYDGELNSLFKFIKDPISSKMYASGEAVKNGGYYLVNNEITQDGQYFNLHKISDSGEEVWNKFLIYGGKDLYGHSADETGNYYGVANTDSGGFYKLSGLDGAQEYFVKDENSSMIEDIYADKDGIYSFGWLKESIGEEYFYLSFYAEAEKSKYAINKAAGDNQIVEVNAMTEPMVSFVTISGTTNPAHNIPVDFTISKYPFNSTGQMLTKTGETTDANGLADVRLRLGNIPAEYTVTANCDECVPEFATVNFTCCGKLHTDEFKQNDDRWGDNILGGKPPAYKIRQTGCALTSVANLINFYAAISTSIARTDPGILNEEMIKKGGYNNNDDVLWDRVLRFTNNLVVNTEILDADYGDTIEDMLLKINEDLLDSLPVIVKVEKPLFNRKRKMHFMLLVGICGEKYIVVDPNRNGFFKYNPYDINLLLQGVRRYEIR